MKCLHGYEHDTLRVGELMLTYSEQSKKYFDRPIEEKMKEKVVSTQTAQGYTADGAESSLKGAVSHKECYEHSRFINNNCPKEGELAEFKVVIDAFYQVYPKFC